MTTESKNPFVGKVLLRQSIASVRLVIALFTITAAVTKLLYDRFLPNLTDLNEMRWAIIGLGCIFFFTTYLRNRRGVVVAYFSFSLYLCTLIYVITFVIINRFDPNAVTILILVIGASTVIINSLFYYGVQSVLIILATLFTFVNADLGNTNLIAFLNLVLAVGVFGIVIAVRLKLIASVKNSYSNLEKLNVLSIVANKSGDIIFVSPSAKSLLGYEPNQLVKDGWWKYQNLKDGWIHRDYILNYPNIIPKEILSLETKLVNKDGKQVWLNWTNSILPNGNYLGLALDITRYKDNINKSM